MQSIDDIIAIDLDCLSINFYPLLSCSGLIVGAIIRYMGTSNVIYPMTSECTVTLPPNSTFNVSSPPDQLKLAMHCDGSDKSPVCVNNDTSPIYHQYTRSTQVTIEDTGAPELEQKVCVICILFCKPRRVQQSFYSEFLIEYKDID